MTDFKELAALAGKIEQSHTRNQNAKAASREKAITTLEAVIGTVLGAIPAVSAPIQTSSTGSRSNFRGVAVAGEAPKIVAEPGPFGAQKVYKGRRLYLRDDPRVPFITATYGGDADYLREWSAHLDFLSVRDVIERDWSFDEIVEGITTALQSHNTEKRDKRTAEYEADLRRLEAVAVLLKRR